MRLDRAELGQKGSPGQGEGRMKGDGIVAAGCAWTERILD